MKKLITLLVMLYLPTVAAETSRDNTTDKSVTETKKHNAHKLARKARTGFNYGVGLMTNREIYKGYNRRNLLIPFIGYKGEKLSVFGPFVSYQLANSSNLSFDVRLAPRFQSFESSDSYIFEGMDSRKFSIDAGLGLGYKIDKWKFKLSTMADILQRSNGVEFSSSISRRFNIGPIFIEPVMSLSYLNSDHVDYYYGVKANEETATRSAYKGSSAINTSVGISIATPILFGGFTRLSIKQTHFDDTITDSPLVEKDKNLAVNVFFTRMF